MRDQERAPRTYELMTILHPEVAEEALPAELDRIAEFIDAAGGSVIESLRDSPWGRRRLAYPIRSGGRDVRDGYYTVWHINLSPHRVNDLERELKLDTQLIRYLVVSWEPKVLTEKEVEAAEIAAEDVAAEAYAAAQAAEAAAESAAADAYAAEVSAAEVSAAEPVAAEESAIALVVAEESALEPVAAEEARAELLEEAAVATETAARLAADESRTEELTAEAEAVEATGAELAIEPVEAIAEREELEVEAEAALSKAETAAAEADADVPAGAMRGDGTGDCPEDYPVKGNATSMLYHSPGSPAYKRTVPEFCFASVEAAEAAGFGPTKFEAAHDESE